MGTLKKINKQEAAFYPRGNDTKLAVIIGQPFERHQDSERRNPGLLNIACKTQSAWQHSAHSPHINGLVN